MHRIRPFRWLPCTAWEILSAYHLESMTEPIYDHDKFAELLVYIASCRKRCHQRRYEAQQAALFR